MLRSTVSIVFVLNIDELYYAGIVPAARKTTLQSQRFGRVKTGMTQKEMSGNARIRLCVHVSVLHVCKLVDGGRSVHNSR